MNTKNINSDILSIKGAFNMGFGIYLRNFKGIFLLAALIIIPMQVFGLIMQDDINYLMLTSVMGIGQNDIHLRLKALVMLLIYAVVFPPLIGGGLGIIIKREAESKKASFSDIINSSIGRIFKHIYTALLNFVIVVLGTMFFVFPGVYLGIVLHAAPNIVGAADNTFGFKALKESLASLRGLFWKALGLFIIVVLFSQVTIYIEEYILYLFSNFPGYSFIEEIIVFLFSIINLYFDLAAALWFLNRYFIYKNNQGLIPKQNDSNS
ncbi:MAG: hypothetical protein E7234_08650 [Lachnospiraceae bacterium]|nr:hypothetical protein [Lachnospiraceae bacterium]